MRTPDATTAVVATDAAPPASPTAQQGPFRIFHAVLDWATQERFQLCNLTDRVQEIVRGSGIRDGLVHLQSLHTTAALFLNEWQEALLEDIRRLLEQLVDASADWRHNDARFSDCDRGNAHAHLRTLLLGQTLCLQLRNARLVLGAWQSIILAEMDGPRSRQIAVQVCGV